MKRTARIIEADEYEQLVQLLEQRCACSCGAPRGDNGQFQGHLKGCHMLVVQDVLRLPELGPEGAAELARTRGVRVEELVQGGLPRPFASAVARRRMSVSEALRRVGQVRARAREVSAREQLARARAVEVEELVQQISGDARGAAGLPRREES